MEFDSLTERLRGRVLGETYVLEDQLGLGGMGAVYRARHRRTGRHYAAKILLPELTSQREALARFQREAEAAAALGHANIVAIHDFDKTEDGLVYIVMDLLDGEDLEARLRRDGALPWATARDIVRQVGGALAAAHAQGIVHRDLKPGNIFLARAPGAPERAVLLDFGLAKVMPAGQGSPKLTRSGIMLGTPLYMSPEQAEGQPVDHRADIFALGVILFEMLAGVPPFYGSSMAAVFAQLLTHETPSLSEHRTEDVPGGIDEVIRRAMAKRPEARYPATTDLVAAVESLDRGFSGDGPARDTIPSEAPGASEGPKLAPTMETPPRPAPEPTPSVWNRSQPSNALPATLASESGLPPGSPPSMAEASAPRKPRRALWLAIIGAAGLTVALAAGGLTAWWISNDDSEGESEAQTAAEVMASAPAAPITPAPAAPIAPAPTPVPPVVQAAVPESATPAAPVIDRTPGSGSSIGREPNPRRQPAVKSGPRAPAKTPSTPAKTPSTPAKTPSTATKLPRLPAGAVPNLPPGILPNDPVVRATQRMAVGDFRGCLRELQGAGTSARVLGARMNCATQANDQAELRRTCQLLKQHHPRHGYTRACSSILGAP